MASLTPFPDSARRRRAVVPVPRVEPESLADGLAGGAAPQVATKADLAALEARLHRHMWIVAATMVSLNVGLTVALLRLLP